MNTMDFAYFSLAIVGVLSCVLVFRYWNKQRRSVLNEVAEGWRECADQWTQCANEHAEKARAYAVLKDYPAHFEHIASRDRCAQNALQCRLHADMLNPSSQEEPKQPRRTSNTKGHVMKLYNSYKSDTTRAISLALQKHQNQPYGGNLHYGVHIFHGMMWMDRMLVHIRNQIHQRNVIATAELPVEILFVDLQTAMALHDIIEDTDLVYGDIMKLFGTRVADLVYSVSGHGKTRKERVERQMKQLTEFPLGFLLKFSDRLANLEACRESQDDRWIRYSEESKETYMRCCPVVDALVKTASQSNAYRDALILDSACDFFLKNLRGLAFVQTELPPAHVCIKDKE